MSDEDQTGKNRSFLARWSQRKHEAQLLDPKPEPLTVDVETAAQSADDAVETFDLSSLPKLEDMTATTDITAFLRDGVPEHLRNAALRKSWALDPAIRNYVNPALEYAYDWNTPGGVPGSSEIGAGLDVARLVSQIMGGESAAEPSDPAADPKKDKASVPAPCSEHVPTAKMQPGLPVEPLRLSAEPVSKTPLALDAGNRNPEAESMRVSETNEAVAPQQAVRRHGTAKPRD